MFLTTVRIHRASRRDVDAVITDTAELAALPRDENRRLDVLSLRVAGHLVALIDPGRAAQSPRIIWQHEKLAVPEGDVRKLIKSAVTFMDAVGGESALSPEARGEGTPFAREPRGRRRGARRATA